MTQNKILYFFFAFTFLATSLFAQQIRLNEAPEDLQLYARDTSNTAEVAVSGEVKGEPDFKAFTLKVFKDNALYDTKSDTLKNKKFSVSSTIKAGLHAYRFEFYINKKGIDSLYFKADDVVCGDAYIITGQSNSHPSSSASTYSNPYCRSFGVKTGYKAYNDKEKKVRWGMATGNLEGLEGVGGWFKINPFGVGVWGMELMKLIVEKHQIPVCIINGGSGSSSIEQNMLYPEKPSLETSFGRLAYRVDQAGLKDKIKAIFWHQGESNAATIEGYQSYATNFDTLLQDWKRVYTNLEKVYLFQLHPGCGRNPISYLSEMREVQNQIDQKYDMVNIMSTLGVTGHDGCHFAYEGYLEFAQRIYPLVARDYYNEKPSFTITPPKLLEANYESSKRMVLHFDQPILLEEESTVDGVVHYLKDQFFASEDSNTKQINLEVNKIKVEGNSLILTLKKASNYKYITYLPSKFYVGTRDIYNGPWLSGSENNIGALSFDRRPITQLKN
ncbi:sialate O-acetylesterase [Algibacter miyuki]|uniref:Sialate O-acetylesterase n=1 Tax=Algibacter miyuki TaxID=1306933 RepID=A0ABV5H1P6_9FLAO|nr:sialate O-acetylesterase [Algibacter miyuki]MDN3667359.1 sialate O-acetylesterase [Algibacter miyuki]